MNLSGGSVRKALDYYKFRLKRNAQNIQNRGDEIFVIADDVNVPFGEVRLKLKGGSGGQNGIEDVIKRVGQDSFARLRVGIGPPGDERPSLDRCIHASAVRS